VCDTAKSIALKMQKSFSLAYLRNVHCAHLLQNRKKKLQKYSIVYSICEKYGGKLRMSMSATLTNMPT